MNGTVATRPGWLICIHTEITRWFIHNQPDADTIDVDLLAHLLLTAMEEGGRLVLNDPETYPPERLTAMARFIAETFFSRRPR